MDPKYQACVNFIVFFLNLGERLGCQTPTKPAICFSLQEHDWCYGACHISTVGCSTEDVENCVKDGNIDTHPPLAPHRQCPHTDLVWFIQWGRRVREHQGPLAACDTNAIWTTLHPICCNVVYVYMSLGIVNKLRPRQNGRRFAEDVFKCIFVN